VLLLALSLLVAVAFLERNRRRRFVSTRSCPSITGYE
jgi:hypothetical protein